MTTELQPRNVICAFYASTSYGSEYRSGFEFIRFAAENGFDLAIISDLDNNSTAAEMEAAASGIKVIHIPSPAKQQATLYRFNDYWAQTLWHWRVARWLSKRPQKLNSLWIQNGASPWLPLMPYFGSARTVIWGPVGGGEPPSAAMMSRLPIMTRFREMARSIVEDNMLRRKFRAAKKETSSRLLVLARTSEAQRRLQKGLNIIVPLIPEILDPLAAFHFDKQPVTTPRFVWVGQDIPRKNLPLALEIVARLRKGAFRAATLDIFGCAAPSGKVPDGVTYHGWVSAIDWSAFQVGGVLLLTSFREGLPSAILEALQNGLLCISSNVGSIGGLGAPTVMVLPHDEYPDYSDESINRIADRVQEHLARDCIELASISNRVALTEFLHTASVI
jgi:glycosyltransferase involved in cell wall biosynthesis